MLTNSLLQVNDMLYETLMNRRPQSYPYRGMQRYYCESKCKDHGHDNEEDVQATVMA